MEEAAGLKGFNETIWNGILAPAGTPKAIVDQMDSDDRMQFIEELPEEAWLRLMDELAGKQPLARETAIVQAPPETEPAAEPIIGHALEQTRKLRALWALHAIDAAPEDFLAKQLDAADELGSIESVKAVSELFSPVSGEVIEVNEALADNPALVNTDPWGDGWMIRIRVSDPTEVDELMTAEEYDEYIEKESAH